MPRDTDERADWGCQQCGIDLLLHYEFGAISAFAAHGFRNYNTATF